MSLIRNTNQKTFSDIWPTYDDMNTDLTTFSFFKPSDNDDTYLQLAYYLVLAKYGDTPISGFRDETRWKLRFFSVLKSYFTEWHQKLIIQDRVVKMTTEELQQGSKAIFNSALNPNTSPSTGSMEELDYINSQNTENRKRSEADALTLKWQLLSSDLNDWFVSKFTPLFSKFIATDVPLYVYDDGGETI